MNDLSFLIQVLLTFDPQQQEAFDDAWNEGDGNQMKKLIEEQLNGS